MGRFRFVGIIAIDRGSITRGDSPGTDSGARAGQTIECLRAGEIPDERLRGNVDGDGHRDSTRDAVWFGDQRRQVKRRLSGSVSPTWQKACEIIHYPRRVGANDVFGRVGCDDHGGICPECFRAIGASFSADRTSFFAFRERTTASIGSSEDLVFRRRPRP